MASTTPTTALPGDSLRRLAGAWNRFWFTPGDPTMLGVMRVACGLMVFYIHLAYCFDLDVFFGKDAWINHEVIESYRHEHPTVAPQLSWDPPQIDMDEFRKLEGEEKEWAERWQVLPSQAVSVGHNWFSVWFHITEPWQMWAMHITILGIIALFTVGFCTRVTGVLTWLAVISYIQRAPTALFGMDTIMNILVIYLMIGPSGAAFSVDRLIRRYRLTRQALANGEPPPDLSRPEPSVAANFALRLLQVHLCFVYTASGLSKLLGQMWWNGTAVWGTMANPEFSPIKLPAYLEGLRLLSEHRWLWEAFMTSSTAFTLFFEVTFVYFIWGRRTRWFAVAGAALLHLGIAVFMGLVTFSLMMLIFVMAFLPPDEFRRLVGLPAREPVVQPPQRALAAA